LERRQAESKQRAGKHTAALFAARDRTWCVANALHMAVSFGSEEDDLEKRESIPGIA
jgi:hypothetical protein